MCSSIVAIDSNLIKIVYLDTSKYLDPIFQNVFWGDNASTSFQCVNRELYALVTDIARSAAVSRLTFQ